MFVDVGELKKDCFLEPSWESGMNMLGRVSFCEENEGTRKVDPFEKFSEVTFLCTIKLLGHEEGTDEQEDELVFHSAKLLAEMSKYSFH